MSLPYGIEVQLHLPYITSYERNKIARGRQEGRLAGKIQLFHELPGEPVATDMELEQFSIPELRQKLEELQ